MTDRLLGVLALVIGGALGWFLFGPIMTAADAHNIGTDTIIAIGTVLAALLLIWSLIDLLRRR